MSLNKRRRVLRQEEIDSLLEESEGDSDLEINLLGDNDGTGWEDSAIESVGELEENINNAESDSDDQNVIPISRETVECQDEIEPPKHSKTV